MILLTEWSRWALLWPLAGTYGPLKGQITGIQGRDGLGLTLLANTRKEQVQIENKIQSWVSQMTAGEEIAIRRKRLRYRAWHRGTKEMDLVLGPFADAHLDNYDEAQLDKLEALMNEEDPPLLKWVLRQEEPPAHVDRSFLDLLIADHEARVAR
jgi:antitoxin CptB